MADFQNNNMHLGCFLQNCVCEIHPENTVSWTVQLLNSFIAIATFCAAAANCPTMTQSTHSEI